jgi:hypothetical protein
LQSRLTIADGMPEGPSRTVDHLPEVRSNSAKDVDKLHRCPRLLDAVATEASENPKRRLIEQYASDVFPKELWLGNANHVHRSACWRFGQLSQHCTVDEQLSPAYFDDLVIDDGGANRDKAAKQLCENAVDGAHLAKGVNV